MKKIYFAFSLTTFFSISDLFSQNINANKTEGCVPLSVSFSFTGTNVFSYSWDFGNGNTSTVSDPAILFDSVGEFEVALIVTYTDNTIDTVKFDKPIRVINRPTSNFEILENTVCENGLVTFKNTSNLATSYLWDFGDGKSSEDFSPQHAYVNGGDYTVTLIAFNNLNCSNVKIVNQAVKVTEIDNLDFDSDKYNSCNEGSKFNFTGPSALASWKWHFGDGNTSTEQNPSYSYTSPGKYSVSLLVTDENGCTAELEKNNFIEIFEIPKINAILPDLPVCINNQSTFENTTTATLGAEWVFSDGYRANGNTISRTFPSVGVYSVTLIVTSNDGCSNQKKYTDAIKIVDASRPNIHISSVEGCVPFHVEMSNNTPDLIESIWEIDGNLYNSQNITHTFERAGKYGIKVVSRHMNDCESITAYDSIITVHKSETLILVSEFSGCSPFTTNFGLSNSAISRVAWDFGNGQTSDELNPTVSFNQPGSYMVTAELVDEFGCTQAIELNGNIEVLSNQISYTTPSPIKTCAAVNVFFDGGMGRDFWIWDFGDGSTATGLNATHFYEAPGNYTVSLTTNNNSGCTATIPTYNQIIVNEVVSDFQAELSEHLSCPYYAVQFTNRSSGMDSVLWDFGDGVASNLQNPSHVFEGPSQFSVKLTVWDENGCYSSSTQIISPPSMCISPIEGINPPYDYYYRELSYCTTPALVEFANPVPMAIEWEWFFDDGTSSNEQNPRHIFTDEGSYLVDMMYMLPDGTQDTLQDFTLVKIKAPEIDFTHDLSAICAGTEVSYRHQSKEVESIKWDFGDGEVSYLESPTKIYTTAGVYQVRLSVSDSSGCQVQTVKNVIIGNPYVQFDYNPTSCSGDTLSVIHNIEGYNTYEWDFGDGQASSQLYPDHTYSERGKYLVNLTAMDTEGCSKVFNLPDSVVVHKPIAGFEAHKDAIHCNLQEVSFVNTSTGSEQYRWNFGNGTTSTLANPVVSFGVGSFDVSLTSVQSICENTIVVNKLVKVDSLSANFSFAQDDECLPAEIRFIDASHGADFWLWDFGDGNTSTEQNPFHIYEKLPSKGVSLTVTGPSGCKISRLNDKMDFFAPDFTVQSSVGCLPFAVVFNNRTNNSLNWMWDFGDGNTSTDRNPTHTYTSTGTYSVQLITQSTSGCYDTLVKENFVKVEDVKASFNADVSALTCTPLLINFENSSIDASDYFWDFGDGSSSTVKNPFHIYSAVGEFDVTLIATNETGCSDTLTYKDLVSATGPQTKFSLSHSVVCHKDTIQFQDLSASATQWNWFFGDGNSSTEKNPSHVYNSPGSYSVSLLASDTLGCEQRFKFDSIYVHPVPKAQFQIKDFTECLPVALDITNSSSNLQNEKYLWDFGDGRSSDKFEPEVIYNTPGRYDLSMIVTNENICSDKVIFERKIVVYDTANLTEPKVFRLSVENNTKIRVEFKPYGYNNFNYNLVWRKEGDEPNFIAFDTLWAATEVLYLDVQVIPSHNSYNYKFQSHVRCHDPIEASQLNVYKSIKLTSTAVDSSIFLSWTEYKGHKFDHYSILRRPEGGSWKEICRVSSNSTSFVDGEDLCPSNYEYLVKAINLNGKKFDSESNSAISRPNYNVFQNQSVRIIRSTVEDNSSVFTEWKIPKIGPDKVVYYQVSRSVNNIDFEPLAKVPAEITNYLDTEVNVQEEQYTYAVDVVNKCDIKAQRSNIGTSLLLQKETIEYLNILKWTQYMGWVEGVSHYFLQRLNGSGEWETLEILDKDQIDTKVDLSSRQE
ncbi:MAG: PKD domain-containing protein [Fulvivirga sp.]